MRASYSKLKRLKVSPAHVILEREQTEAMLLGSAFHSYILQPEKFNAEFRVFNDEPICKEIGGKMPRATTKYKEWLQTLPTDKTLLKAEKIMYFDIFENKLQNDKIFSAIMKNAIIEEKIIFQYQVTDDIVVECSAVPDIVNLERKIIVDLKTCQSAETSKFTKDVATLDYHMQAAMYIQACKQHYGDGDWTFMFLACETNEPYLYQWFECENQLVAMGKSDVEMLLLLWNDCLTNGFDRGYEVFCENKLKIQKISLPAWKQYEIINFY